MSEVTVYHNPNCGTSRNVLGLIRSAGIEPTIIEYLKAPPDRQTLLGHELGARAFVVRTLGNLFPSAADERPRYRSSPGYYGQARSR